MPMTQVMVAWREACDAYRYGYDDESLAFDQFMVAHNDPSHLCTEFDSETGNPTKAGIAGGEQFIARARNWTSVAWWFYARGQKLMAAKLAAYCAFFGHDTVDESCIGPNSGTEHIRCKRCGWSFSHTYY